MRLPVLVTVLMLVATAPVLSQSPPTSTLAAGTWSFSFSLPSGGGTNVGIWRMMSSRTNLGVSLGFSAFRSTTDHGDSASSLSQERTRGWSLRAEPTLKLYRHVRSDVAPFLLAQLGASYYWSAGNAAAGSPRRRDWNVYSRLGAGADWFPAAAVSIGGWVAVAFTASGGRASEAYYGISDNASLNVATLTSALLLHVYF